MLGLTSACMLLTVSILFFILGYLVWHGGKDVTWNFFTKLPAPVGETGGGMANAIVGTAKLLLLAMVFGVPIDRKSTRLNSSHPSISYAVFCLKKKKKNK